MSFVLPLFRFSFVPLRFLNSFLFLRQSWGTKGQDKVATDLGVVTSGKGANKQDAEVEVTVGDKDLDAEYDDASEPRSLFLFLETLPRSTLTLP